MATPNMILGFYKISQPWEGPWEEKRPGKRLGRPWEERLFL